MSAFRINSFIIKDDENMGRFLLYSLANKLLADATNKDQIVWGLLWPGMYHTQYKGEHICVSASSGGMIEVSYNNHNVEFCFDAFQGGSLLNVCELRDAIFDQEKRFKEGKNEIVDVLKEIKMLSC